MTVRTYFYMQISSRNCKATINIMLISSFRNIFYKIH